MTIEQLIHVILTNNGYDNAYDIATLIVGHLGLHQERHTVSNGLEITRYLTDWQANT